MSIIITTNEPKQVKELFHDRIETPLGFDFKLYTKTVIAGIERKKVPGDLLASVDDGRLRDEINAMREECQICIVLLHGIIKYRQDGTVYIGQKYHSRWNRKGIRNLKRTLEYVEECYVEYAQDNRELVEIVYEIQDYLDKGNHLSMKGRPGIQARWLVPNKADRTIYFYQGISTSKRSRLGAIGARKLYDKFPNPMELYGATVPDIAEISGFGNTTASGIYNFLRGNP